MNAIGNGERRLTRFNWHAQAEALVPTEFLAPDVILIHTRSRKHLP